MNYDAKHGPAARVQRFVGRVLGYCKKFLIAKRPRLTIPTAKLAHTNTTKIPPSTSLFELSMPSYSPGKLVAIESVYDTVEQRTHDIKPMRDTTTKGLHNGFAKSFSNNVAMRSIDPVERVVTCFR